MEVKHGSLVNPTILIQPLVAWAFADKHTHVVDNLWESWTRSTQIVCPSWTLDQWSYYFHLLHCLQLKGAYTVSNYVGLDLEEMDFYSCQTDMGHLLKRLSSRREFCMGRQYFPDDLTITMGDMNVHYSMGRSWRRFTSRAATF